MFGEMIRERRMALGLSLRAFCAKHGEDASNWSKLERGLINPPAYERLLQIGRSLEFEEDGAEMNRLFDMADSERGTIPNYIMKDADLVKKLPILFRTLKDGVPTEDDLMKTAQLIREANTPE